MIMADVNEGSLKEMEGLVGEGVTSFKLFMAYPGVLYSDDGQVLLQLIESEDQPGYRRLYSRHEWLCLHALALRLSGSDARLRRLVTEWAGEPGAAESAYYWSHETLLRMLLDAGADPDAGPLSAIAITEQFALPEMRTILDEYAGR